MIYISCVLPVVLLGVCKSESVSQFTRYRILTADVKGNISASTMMTTIVGCDQFYSSRSTRTIVYHSTLQLCQLYEENKFPLMILPAPSPPWTVYIKGTFYALVKILMTWTDAELNCEVNSGQLVKIESAEENYLLLSWLQLYAYPLPARGPWIGLNDRAKEGKYTWADGSSLGTYKSWDSNNPNNGGGIEDCVHIALKRPVWNDAPCSFELWSICEFD